MKRFIIIVLLSAFAFSCTTENAKIKRALKGTIPVELQKGYKLKEYYIVETILDINIKDSISTLRSKQMTNEFLNKNDSTRLADLQSSLREARHGKATTLYLLRSSYDSIIRTYEEMIEETEEKINQRIEANAALGKTITRYENALSSTSSPIIYYRVRHNYSIDGAIRDTTITLSNDYQLIIE